MATADLFPRKAEFVPNGMCPECGWPMADCICLSGMPEGLRAGLGLDMAPEPLARRESPLLALVLWVGATLGLSGLMVAIGVALQ